MIRKKGYCKEDGCDVYSVLVAGLCPKHYHAKRRHEALEKARVKKQALRAEDAKWPNRKDRGDGREIDLYNECYAVNVIRNRWVSAISGEPLPKRPAKGEDNYDWKMSQWVSCFSHILPKGKYRPMKHWKTAFVLMTPEEHTLYGTNPAKIHPTPRDNWDRLFEIRDELFQIVNREGYDAARAYLARTIAKGHIVRK